MKYMIDSLTPKKVDNQSCPQPRLITDEWAVLAGLRAMLAVTVVWAHAVPFQNIANPRLESIIVWNGAAAVYAFLVVSGYSIAASISNAGEAINFYQRRAWRILPVYLFSLLLSVLPWLTEPHICQSQFLMQSAPTFLQVIQNAVFLQGWTVRVVGTNLPLWSLSVEVFFYLLAPLLVRLPRTFIMLIMAASICVYNVDVRVNDYPFSIGGITHESLLWAWLSGWCLWYFRDSVFTKFVLLTGGLIWVSFYGIDLEMGFCIVATSVITVIYAKRIVFPVQMKSVLVYLGNVSYPLYCIHYSALFWIVSLNGLKTIGKNNFLLLPLLIASGIIMYHLIDVPFRKYARNQKSKLVSAG